MKEHPTSSFSSKLGLIMAAAGSAVGLGNIWKFPYIAGENGGGAFLIIYLICVILFGLPMVLTEFLIGKRSGKSVYGAFNELKENNHWHWLGWLCMMSAFLIMGFYFLVTGWCFSYLVEAIGNVFHGLDSEALAAHFTEVSGNKLRMIGFGLIPVVLTAVVLWFDVNKGIERLSKILMPLLLLMMILMAIRVLMLDGSNAGVQFFFNVDFTKVTPKVILEAMGQCFFSLSIGMGALITYGAYMPKNQSATYTSIQVISLDTIVALLAGVIIFPAVFAFGFNPAEGPQLVFVVLPAIFEQMSLAWLSSVLFFILLCIAAITSTISLMEVAVAFITEASKGRLNRQHSVLITSAIVIVLIVVCTVIPQSFDVFDKLTACIMLPIGALGMSLFVGWSLPAKNGKGVLRADKGARYWFGKVYIFMLRWLVPVAILLVLLNSLGIFK